MHRKSRLPLAALGALLAGPAAANIDIVFDYYYDSGGFFSDSLRKSLMDSAASVFESRITDSLGAITSAGISRDFSVIFQNPSISPIPTATNVTLTNVYVATDVIRIYVGATNLGSDILGEGGPGGFDSSGPTNVARDQIGYLNDNGIDTDFGPWGGSISFNSSFSSWYFDSTLATSNDISGYDFYSVALHEIGHVLGYGTANSWTKHISGICPGACSIIGKPLADTAHWAYGALSQINGAGNFVEVAMDPNISINTRKNFTDQDWAGMTAIGWQVAAVPEPEAWAMLLAGLGLVGFAAARKEKRRQG